MTDYEQLKELFTFFKIGFTERVEPDGAKTICCQEGDKNIDGYNSFFTNFEFTSEGKFIRMGAWE